MKKRIKLLSSAFTFALILTSLSACQFFGNASENGGGNKLLIIDRVSDL